MKSNNEEYLDNLLQSLKRDANSGIAKTTSEALNIEDTADLGEMIGSSSENNDLNEIGEMFEKLDGGQLLDTGMTEVLDSISMPIDESVPKYTVGDEISDSYEKDDDELALDEAIARAEAMQAGSIEEEVPEVNIPEMPPIDGLSGSVPVADTGINERLEEMNSEGMDNIQDDFMSEIAPELPSDADDALLEVAPEIPIPDDESGDVSDSHESPEEILDDMMRFTPEEALGLDEPMPSEGLDEMLNIDDMLNQQESENENSSETDDILNLVGIDTGITDEVFDEDIALDEGMIPTESVPETEVSLEGIDLGSSEPEISLGEIDLSSSAEVPSEEINIETTDAPIDETASEDEISLEGMDLGASEDEISLDGVDLGEAGDEISLDGIDLGGGEETPAEEIDLAAAEASLDAIAAGDEISLDDMDSGDSGDISLEGMDLGEVGEAAPEGIDMDDTGEEVSLDGIDLGDNSAETPAEEIDLAAAEASIDEMAAGDEISLEGMDSGEAGDEISLEGMDSGEAGDEIALEGMDSGEVGDEISLEGMDFGEVGEPTPEEATDEINLEEMEMSLDFMDEAAEAPAEEAAEPMDEASLEESLADFAEAMSQDEAGADEAIDDADMNLESMSAELDDLLKEVGEDGGDISAVGDGIGSEAELDNMLADLNGEEGGADGDNGEDVDMPDLDAIMNSLASDDVEDLENTAHIDEKEGAGADEINLDDLGVELGEPSVDGAVDEGSDEPSPDEIMEALGEEGTDEIGLSDEIPDPDEIDDNGGDYDEISLHVGGGEPEGEGEEGGKKKKKRKGLLALLFGALFKVLTQTDEDLNPPGEGGELASLTDENQQVLDELAAEDGKKAKKEKKKKEKKEKPKKEKKPPKEKKPKPPKEKKPKKEKKKKVDDGQPEKALAPKKVAIAMLFAFSLGFLCCLPSMILPNRILMDRAQTAFDHQDYQATYKLLYGKKLNEEQTLLYHQARVLSCANHYVSSYNNYIAMNMKDEALDSLLKAMRAKKTIVVEAEEFQVAGDVENVYSNIESILANDYGLTLAEVDEINDIKDVSAYTKRVMEITGTLEKLISSITN